MGDLVLLGLIPRTVFGRSSCTCAPNDGSNGNKIDVELHPETEHTFDGEVIGKG